MATKTEQRKKNFEDQLEKAKRVHDRHRERWLVMDEVYHGKKKWPKEREDTLRSRLRIPWAWQQIETIIPRIMDPDPKFEYRPVEQGDFDFATALNTLVRWQLNEDRFVLKQRDWVEDGLVRGLAVAKVIWKREKQTLSIRQTPSPLDVARKKTPKPKKKTVIVDNRPTIVYVDPFDFLWDPAATNETEWRYVFHRLWLTMEDLKQREKDGMYSNVKDLEEDGSERAQRSTMENSDEVNAKRGDRFAVYERWHTDGTVMVMCGDTVLRDDPNPFYHGDIPFVTFSTQPTPRSMVGLSEVEKIDHIQEAIWTRDNQRIDAVSLALNQVLILDPTIQGVRNLTFKPGAKIYANQGQRVEQLRLDPLQIPAFNETEAYLGAMQQMTGANAILYGASLEQSGIDNKTATGVNAAREEGNMRMEMKKLGFKLFEARIARLMVQLSHQYLSQSEVTRVIGEEAAVGYKVPQPEEIPMFLDVIPEGMTESMSKSMERSSLLELLNIVKELHGAPMSENMMFTVQPFIEKAIKLWDQDPAGSFVPAPQQQQGPDGPPPA